jgi:hypothetical protein
LQRISQIFSSKGRASCCRQGRRTAQGSCIQERANFSLLHQVNGYLRCMLCINIIAPLDHGMYQDLATTCCMQASNIDKHLSVLPKPNKSMQHHARNLLSTALLQTNCPPVFLENSHFKEYIRYISGDRYHAPSRYLHMDTVESLAA